MGLEAYRIGVKISYSNKDEINTFLENSNAVVIEVCKNGDIEYEIANSHGYIEILLTKNKGRNFVYSSILQIRLAKPNAIETIDDIISLIAELSKNCTIERFIDLEFKKSIDISNHKALIDDFKKAKNEFENNFSRLPFPIRCVEVFPKYRELNPEKVKNRYLT